MIGYKVFSATIWRKRQALGEVVTEWIRSSGARVVDKWIVQSSDASFHCISIVIRYETP